jgi:hypothetical protein|tara:strand:- start:68 stop:478 length:411 start_codon:yes stop_codon:yes gene_type:complete
MNLEYTFIAIMFPAIPLTMVMFGNRFHTTSVLIRQMHDEYIYEKVMPAEFNQQLKILKSRIILLKRAQIAMGLSFLFNMLSVFALFFNAILPAKFFFGLCLLSIIVALIIYLYEITLSTKALKYHLLDLDNMNKKK